MHTMLIVFNENMTQETLLYIIAEMAYGVEKFGVRLDAGLFGNRVSLNLLEYSREIISSIVEYLLGLPNEDVGSIEML